MKFSDFVKAESIRADLNASDKEGVIRELVACLVESGQLESGEQENIVEAILKREKIGEAPESVVVSRYRTPSTPVSTNLLEPWESVPTVLTLKVWTEKKFNFSLCSFLLRIVPGIT